MSRPFARRSASSSFTMARINGKIRAPEVRVIGTDGRQLGVFALRDAIVMARSNGVDLVEIAASATPPVCRLVDYGKYRYEQAKKDKEQKKHQHGSRVKEIQLSPSIDPHDFDVKFGHAVDFLCEDMKVKVTLRFRGREMAHQDIGLQVVNRFIEQVAPFGHPDALPRLVGRGIILMLSPLPRNKRAPHPGGTEGGPHPNPPGEPATRPPLASGHSPVPKPSPPVPAAPSMLEGQRSSGFVNNPFAALDGQVG